MRFVGRLGFAAVILTMAMPVAWSQTPPTSPPVGSEPALTTATYGDWLLRCQSVTLANAPKRVCEVVQTMQVQGRPEPIAQVAFGKAQDTGDLHFVAALPVNVSFPSSVVVTVGDKDTRPLTLEWKRCIPGACFADASISADVLTRWRAATVPAKVQFKDASGRDTALPVSFRGMAQALDALNKVP